MSLGKIIAVVILILALCVFLFIFHTCSICGKPRICLKVIINGKTEWVCPGCIEQHDIPLAPVV
jgi:hypothetical protein